MRFSFSGDLRWNVVQEVGAGVELGTVPVGCRRASLRGSPAGVVPPSTGSLARYGDHRIDQDKLPNSRAAAYQRCCEGAQRLSDEHHVMALADGLDNQSRVIRQTGVFVVTGEIDGDGVMASSLQQGNDAAPVPGCAAGSGYQNERTHRRASKIPPPSRASRTNMG